MSHYQHSGRSGAAGVPLVAAIGVPSAAALGCIYAYALNWIPVAQLNALATVGFGCGLGGVVGWAAGKGKIRNSMISGGLGLVVGALGLYVAWAFDPLARFGAQGFIAWDPMVLWQYMQVGLEEGFWSVGRDGSPVKGAMLATTWVAEAIIVLSGCAFVAHKFSSGRPFCEECEQWTTTERGIAQLDMERFTSADAAKLAQGALDVLDQFPAGAVEHPFLRLDLATCPTCNDSNYVSVLRVWMGKDGNGYPTEMDEAILKNFAVDEDQIPALRAAGILPRVPVRETGPAVGDTPAEMDAEMDAEPQSV